MTYRSTSAILNTRVEGAAEATNLSLLESMDRRAQLQLRIQETVEGLSAAAIIRGNLRRTPDFSVARDLIVLTCAAAAAAPISSSAR